MINFLFEIIVGISLLIYSAMDISESSEFFLNYSKPKTILLAFHLLLIIIIILLGLLLNWKIPNKIKSFIFSINDSVFNIAIITSFSLLISIFWMNSYSELINYWFYYEKLIPFIIWIAIFLLHIVFFRFQNISLKKFTIKIIENFSINKLIPYIFIIIFSLIIFILLGSSFILYKKEYIYTIHSPFNLFHGLFFSLLVSSVFYIFIKNTIDFNKTQNKKLFFFGLSSLIGMLLFGQLLRFDETFFQNWNETIVFFNFKPLIYFLFFIFFGFFIEFLIIQYNKYQIKILDIENKKLYLLSLFILFIFFTLIYFFGFIKNIDDHLWNQAGNPITFSQLFCSLVFLLLILFFSRKIKKREHLIALLLFGLFFIVAILWQWSPDLRNYFIQMPEKPNFTYFPYSDAQNFDYGGQFLRFGYGIENFEDTTYPFTMFLTNIYHFFAKQDFVLTYQIQMFLMILIPVGIFFISKKLDSIELGIFSSVLIIFQEANAIKLSGDISNVHLQLLMSEIPTLLFLVWGTYFLISGLKKSKSINFLLSGTILGFASLCRLNPIFVFLAFSIILIFYILNKKEKLKNIILFINSYIFIFGGWYFYIYLHTGYFFFWDKIKSVLRRNQAIFSPSLHQLSSILSNKMMYFDSLVNTFHNLFNNFLNNIFSAFILLPNSIQSSSPISIHSINYKFWNPHTPWNGQLTIIEILIIFVNLFLITFGISKLWKKNKWLSLIPLFVLIAYSASLGAARASGGRYLTPINWILVFYYSCGVLYLFKHLFPSLFIYNFNQVIFYNSEEKKNLFKIIILSSLLIIFILMMIWPFVYPEKDSKDFNEIKSIFYNVYQNNNLETEDLDKLLASKDVIAVDGIALYPIINENALEGKLINSNYYDFVFYFKNDNNLKLPHDTNMYILGHEVLNHKIQIDQYIYLDKNGTWQLFISKDNQFPE